MDLADRCKKIKFASHEIIMNRLKNHYSAEIFESFNTIGNQHSTSDGFYLEIILMDVVWQLSRIKPSDEEIALFYTPVYCFFLGTTFQDDLLDSFNVEHTRNLVQSLGNVTSLLLGNILYHEAESIMSELAKNMENELSSQIQKSMYTMISKVFEIENFRRNKIGQVLSLQEFFAIWEFLTPNKVCIEISGSLARLDQTNIELLTKIGLNLSIINRIRKETNEIYGLQGSIVEKLKNKPPSFPITLAYEEADEFEKKVLEKALQILIEIPEKKENKDVIVNNISILMSYITKYKSISKAMQLHSDILQQTKELVSKIDSNILQAIIKNMDLFEK